MRSVTRPRIVAALAGLLVAIGAVSLSVFVPQQDGGDHGSLAPLPPGPPKMQAVEATIESVSLGELKARSRVVFVGTVVAEGGSEGIGVAGPPESGGELTVHRVRFSVERTLRGEDVRELDVIVPDISELDGFEIGERYLVFSENRAFGDGRVSGQSPTGYYQGSFRAIGDNARNDRTAESLSINELASELRRNPQ